MGTGEGRMEKKLEACSVGFGGEGSLTGLPSVVWQPLLREEKLCRCGVGMPLFLKKGGQRH